MIIQQDTRQKLKHHLNKEKWFEKHGIKIVHSKMLVGDYCIPSDGSISVDTKKDIGELYSNLIQQHKRFAAECQLADELGINLYVLVENEDGIKSKDDIMKWRNPQYFVYMKRVREGAKVKPPASNLTLKKIMASMERKYGVTFLFCSPIESAEIIYRLLLKVEDNEPTPFPERE